MLRVDPLNPHTESRQLRGSGENASCGSKVRSVGHVLKEEETVGLTQETLER